MVAGRPLRCADAVGGRPRCLVQSPRLQDLYAGGVSQFARTRSATVGPWTRPVAIPDDIDDRGLVKAAGVVELPSWVRWSGPPRRYDLTNRRERALVYEQVLTEGTEDDVRYFVVLDDLIDLWDDLVLPGYVRTAWATWLEARRGIVVGC
jgi:hypothetical protein